MGLDVVMLKREGKRVCARCLRAVAVSLLDELQEWIDRARRRLSEPAPDLDEALAPGAPELPPGPRGEAQTP